MNRDGSLDAWISGWINGDCSNGCSTEPVAQHRQRQGSAGQHRSRSPRQSQRRHRCRQRHRDILIIAPADDTTPAAALRYNLYLRDTESGRILSTLPADITTGYIKVADTRGAIRRCEHTLRLPDDGNYRWGVQAIDASNEGGAFASSTLDISGVGSVTVDDSAVKVEGGSGCIRIYAPDGASAAIYTPAGVLTTETAIGGVASINAAAGIYIVTVATDGGISSHKVVVK